MKARTLNEVMNSIPSARRKKIEARAARAIAEEMTLRELRKAKKLSQDTVAKNLGIKQSDVSKIEHRVDVYVSTLRNFIRATGGELEIIAKYPDKQAVRINQFEDIGNDEEELIEA